MAEEQPIAPIKRNHNTVRVEVWTTGVISRQVKRAENNAEKHVNGAGRAAAVDSEPGFDPKHLAGFQWGSATPPT